MVAQNIHMPSRNAEGLGSLNLIFLTKDVKLILDYLKGCVQVGDSKDKKTCGVEVWIYSATIPRHQFITVNPWRLRSPCLPHLF